MHAQLDQAERETVKFLFGDGLAFSTRVGNLPVLAEEAVACAALEENRAGAARAAETWFLAYVRAV